MHPSPSLVNRPKSHDNRIHRMIRHIRQRHAQPPIRNRKPIRIFRYAPPLLQNLPRLPEQRVAPGVELAPPPGRLVGVEQLRMPQIVQFAHDVGDVGRSAKGARCRELRCAVFDGVVPQVEERVMWRGRERSACYGALEAAD